MRVNGMRIKPSRQLNIEDVIAVARGSFNTELVVKQLSKMRGPATLAATMYEETPASHSARAAKTAHDGHSGARPTKRERRRLDYLIGQ